VFKSGAKHQDFKKFLSAAIAKKDLVCLHFHLLLIFNFICLNHILMSLVKFDTSKNIVKRRLSINLCRVYENTRHLEMQSTILFGTILCIS
jgi:hypothetical protein